MAILEGKGWRAWIELRDRTVVMEAVRRNHNPEWRAGFPEEMAEKIKLEPRMVRFEPVALMSRLRLKLRMRLRTYALRKDEKVHLQRSYLRLAGG